MGCFFYFFFIGWVGPKVTSRVRQYVARHYDALTLYAVRGYVALTQDVDPRQYVILTAVREPTGRATWRAVNCLLEFFGLVASCPRLAGRLCLSLAIDLE